MGSSNERHWGRNMGRWEEFKKGNFTKTWNQRKKTMRKLVKSFTSWVKTCMVEKHAHQQICWLHPIDAKNKFSAWKKKMSVHIFPGFKASAYSQRACTRLSDSTKRCIKNFPLGLQETRCLNKVATQDDPRWNCWKFKWHRWLLRAYSARNNKHIRSMLLVVWSSIYMKCLECINSTEWFLIFW